MKSKIILNLAISLDGFIADEHDGIIPIILGSGIPLFLHGHAPIPLELTHHYVEDGVAVLRYVPRKKGV